jgi:hypothetical protein
MSHMDEQMKNMKEGRKKNNSLYYSRHRDELKRKREAKKGDTSPKPARTPEELNAMKQEYNRRYQEKLKTKRTTTGT